MKLIWAGWTILTILSVSMLLRWWFPKRNNADKVDWRGAFFDLFAQHSLMDKELRQAKKERDEWEEKYETLKTHLREGQKL